MKEVFCRFGNTIKYWLISVINNHKGWLVAFGITFFVAAITGIMTTINYLDVVTYENLINKYLMELLANKRSYMSFFLIMSLWFLLVNVFLIYFARNVFMVVVDFILIAILSYIWGFDICIIVMTLGLAGVIYGVVVLGLLGIIINSMIVGVASCVSKKFFTFKNNCDEDIKRQYCVVFLVLILFGLCVLFVMSFMFCSIRIFVIVD